MTGRLSTLFGPFEMNEFPTVREVYEAHLKDAAETRWPPGVS